MSGNPGVQTLGNDISGFYKPALQTYAGTTIGYGGGLPVTVTLNRADEIRVGGIRVNGAFTVGPEGVQFGGAKATLRVEFSEADAAAYAGAYAGAYGVAAMDFVVVRMTYPPNYPANKEAASVTAVYNMWPTAIRIENGRQIYAITVPLASIAATPGGSTYGAVPRKFAVPGPDTIPLPLWPLSVLALPLAAALWLLRRRTNDRD
jgi:hypothetical protein